jgi:hypothetical protein
MDNTNNISQSILQTNETSLSLSSNNNGGFFDSLKNVNMTTWLLIILILAFLGFNIFVYLAKGTQDVTNFFAPLLNKLFGITIGTTGQVLDVSAEGAKAVVGETAGAVQTGLTAVQYITPNAAKSSVSSQPINQEQKSDIIQNSSLNKALNSTQEQQPMYEADNATSSIQGGGKSGWCYIGEDRGFRSCAEIGVNDKCMSGEIFSTHEICMNPNLRN